MTFGIPVGDAARGKNENSLAILGRIDWRIVLGLRAARFGKGFVYGGHDCGCCYKEMKRQKLWQALWKTSDLALILSDLRCTDLDVSAFLPLPATTNTCASSQWQQDAVCLWH